MIHVIPSGTSEVRHYHQTHQFFFILSSTATSEIAGDRQILCQHEGVEVACNPHQIINAAEENLDLVISQPPSDRDRILHSA